MSTEHKRKYGFPVTTLEPEQGDEVFDSNEHEPADPPRIRCPKCNWSPKPSSMWKCVCGHEWNTFDTGGICPSCMFQWTNTQCLQCQGWSAHSAWYTHPAD